MNYAAKFLDSRQILCYKLLMNTGVNLSKDISGRLTVAIDPALQTKNIPSPLRGEGRGEGDFQDLRRELVSRKYSYKTIKGYLYYNRDFLGFVKKQSSEINDSDIKDYLLYLAEKKQSATSTLNQAINALKFYYGGILKKKFVYEVKRPRKDKKLPVVLSKEEVARIINSMDNLKHRAILMIAYSSGLRVSEVVKLKIEDIDPVRNCQNYCYNTISMILRNLFGISNGVDSKRMLIHIKGSKGRKDRYTQIQR